MRFVGFMDLKREIFFLCIIVIFSSLIAVSASDNPFKVHDINEILKDNDVDDMTGCCSVIFQEDNSSAIMSFRRDAKTTADITIEKINWHGKDAIKQYKTEGGYFCQVIITSDGWMIGFGGEDDGPDNEKIENITAGMINDNYTISNESLAEIEAIKKPYKLGHAVIKAPNGNYGIATDKGHFTSKLNPGEYLSMPNRYTYFRSGNITLNSTTDKVKTMVELAISDGFGLTRRDVTTFDFNVSDNANVTKIYVSNDDGSTFGMNCGGLYDNVIFNGTTTNGEDIPVAPSYKELGNITFEGNNTATNSGILNFWTIILFVIIAIIVAAVAFFSYHTVKVLKYRRRRNRRYKR